MIEIVGKRRVDLGQRQMRHCRDNFIGRFAANFCIDVNILHSNARSHDKRAQLTRTIWAKFDMLDRDSRHQHIIDQIFGYFQAKVSPVIRSNASMYLARVCATTS